jgi:hypothetical protein
MYVQYVDLKITGEIFTGTLQISWGWVIVCWKSTFSPKVMWCCCLWMRPILHHFYSIRYTCTNRICKSWNPLPKIGQHLKPSENRHEGEIAKSRDMVAVEAHWGRLWNTFVFSQRPWNALDSLMQATQSCEIWTLNSQNQIYKIKMVWQLQCNATACIYQTSSRGLNPTLKVLFPLIGNWAKCWCIEAHVHWMCIWCIVCLWFHECLHQSSSGRPRICHAPHSGMLSQSIRH